MKTLIKVCALSEESESEEEESEKEEEADAAGAEEKGSEADPCSEYIPYVRPIHDGHYDDTMIWTPDPMSWCES